MITRANTSILAAPLNWLRFFFEALAAKVQADMPPDVPFVSTLEDGWETARPYPADPLYDERMR